MSYEFIKLNEVELVENVSNANILIEENGEIKRLAAEDLNITGGSGEHYQADWLEEDESHPAFILNKPSVRTLGVINYTESSGTIFAEGIPQNYDEIVDAWENGTDMRFNGKKVVEVTYGPYSGGQLMVIYYVNSGQVQSYSRYI